MVRRQAFLLASMLLAATAGAQPLAADPPAGREGQVREGQVREGRVREGRGENELVLIHGLGADATVWTNVAGLLAGSLQVYTYELHGHGKTPPLPAPTIASEAEALGQWLKEKDLPFPTLVGHGMGGMIALQFALDHPRDVKNLVLIDATPRQLASADDRQQISKALLADYDRFVASRYFAVSAVDSIARRAVDLALRTDSATLASLLLNSFGWDVSGRLATFSVPMLVLGSDNFLPESGYERETLTEYGFDQAPDLHFRKLVGLGHYAMLENPGQLAALILVYARQE